MIFDDYALYYNLLYKDKNYQEEADYVIKKIKKYKPDAAAILDLGCGTGKHDYYFSKNGFAVAGVDASGKMIDTAKNNYPDIEFYNNDIRSLKLNKKFDAAVSLFHVMSYQTSNNDLINTIQSAYRHLEKNGLFIFDFWYGPAVLTDRPAVRIKRLEDENIQITRIAQPIMHPNENIVDVSYEVIVENKNTKKIERIFETHKMRYLFLPELDNLLKENNFRILDFNEWLTDKKPDFFTWNGFVVAQAVQ